MSEEKPHEIDDAWLKRREDWCAAFINKNTTARYAAELMLAMCVRIRADGKRMAKIEKAARSILDLTLYVEDAREHEEWVLRWRTNETTWMDASST